MVEEIKIVENNIYVDHKLLKEIILDEWQSGNLYRHFYKQGLRGRELYWYILDEVADYADALQWQIRENAQKQFGKPDARLDWGDKYPKTDPHSISFEVLHKLSLGGSYEPEELTTDDIPMIIKFLDTPPGHELEAWDEWEKYWANLDYAERRKKLLEGS